MKAFDAIRMTLDASMMVLTQYLSDLSDSDLLVRPAPGANHPAWQLGHLICSEFEMMEAIRPGRSPALPKGFAEAHTVESSASDDPKSFFPKKTYLDLYQAQRRVTLEILEGASEAELNSPSPEPYRAWAPTVGALLNGAGTHLMMHVGQFAVLRRKLGKPIKI